VTGPHSIAGADELLRANRGLVQLYHRFEQDEAFLVSLIESIVADIRNGHRDQNLGELRTALEEIERTDIPPRYTYLVDGLRSAVHDAHARGATKERPSEELVYLDEAPKPVVRLKGRLGTIRKGSNELCLTPEQVRTIIAEGDDA
jgi:hypothetical protein